MARLLATLEARLRARFTASFERRAQLVNKAIRVPGQFLADARSPLVRRFGEIATDFGLLPAADDLEAAVRGPRHVPFGHRDPHVEASRASLIEGALVAVEGNRLVGYADAGAEPAVLIALVNDVEIARFVAAQIPTQPAQETKGRRAFDVCVDLRATGLPEGADATLRVVCAVSGRVLDGTPRTVRIPRYEGAIRNKERGRITGYVRDTETGHPVYLDVLVEDRYAARLSVATPRMITHPAITRWLCAFAASYVPRRTDETFIVRVRGTDRPLFGTKSAFEAAHTTSPTNPPLAKRMYADAVNVIIPVYADLEISMRCVRSAIAAKNDVATLLTVVYDAGPDPQLLDALRASAHEHAFELVENAQNLGFVKTCNLAMRLHPDHDVVLLNADTEVADGWLDRLARAARGSADIGTATPFSNAATICTYPMIGDERPLREDTNVAKLDARFAEANAGTTVELPTGHGFCLFLTRAMLDAVGLFDEDAFGRGYGEENDLCLRARAAGYRHVLACDVFVKHVGSVSFGTERSERVRNALATIARRYPAYHAEVARFIRRDPLAFARNRVIVAEIRERRIEKPHGCMLMVTHHLGGGIDVHVKDLSMRLEREGMLVLELRSHADGTYRLRTADALLEAVYFPGADAEPQMLADLRAIGIRHVHVHHWLTLPAFVLGLADALGVPFDVTLHDFFAACPRVNFVRADGAYCGEPDATTCDTCIAVDGRHEAARYFETSPLTSVAAHRAEHRAFLARARRVITPSHDTAERTAHGLGPIPMRAMPHPERLAKARFQSSPKDAPVYVAVLGGIGLHKGYLALLDVARHAHEHRLPLRFVVFGTTTSSGTLRRLSNVEVTGRYEHADLPDLVARSQCTVAAFFSIWPETFSYTLSEAIALGLYPVSFDLGAPAERLRAFGHGRLVSPSATASEICAALIEAGRAPKPTIELDGPFTDYASLLDDYYALSE